MGSWPRWKWILENKKGTFQRPSCDLPATFRAPSCGYALGYPPGSFRGAFLHLVRVALRANSGCAAVAFSKGLRRIEIFFGDFWGASSSDLRVLVRASQDRCSRAWPFFSCCFQLGKPPASPLGAPPGFPAAHDKRDFGVSSVPSGSGSGESRVSFLKCAQAVVLVSRTWLDEIRQFPTI